MNGYAIIMYAFGFCVFLAGIYVYTGHDGILTRGYYKKASKDYLKFIGRTIMITSIAPILSGLSTLLIDEDNIWLPLVVLLGFMILGFIISILLKRGSNENN